MFQPNLIYRLSCQLLEWNSEEVKEDERWGDNELADVKGGESEEAGSLVAVSGTEKKRCSYRTVLSYPYFIGCDAETAAVSGRWPASASDHIPSATRTHWALVRRDVVVVPTLRSLRCSHPTTTFLSALNPRCRRLASLLLPFTLSGNAVLQLHADVFTFYSIVAMLLCVVLFAPWWRLSVRI